MASAINTLKSGLGVAGYVARDNLERLGSFLDGLDAKSGKTTQYTAVDLTQLDEKSQQDLFRQKTVEASQQLIGQRFSRYGKFAKKVVPNSMVEKAMDAGFMQVAKLASVWSQTDLPEGRRFADVRNMSEHERNGLVADITNQNRALATLGGVTGLAGLPGLLADSVWMLLVSLRTIYQVAEVYDRPLTGKQGMKLAYQILSNADLSKMQEKQALLAGIGVANRLLESADNRGLRNELENAGVHNENVRYYANQVDSLIEQFNIDIDNIDLSWLTKFLPVTAVAIGSHYNHMLINEVIGVVTATFGPEPKMAKQALTDASGSSDDGVTDHVMDAMDGDDDTNTTANPSDND